MIIEIATYLDPRACYGDCQPLMAMSQVCHYWRETLISNPESWYFIRSEYLDLLPLFLERSRSYPLEVELTDTSFSDTLQHIRPHADRLAVLKCYVETPNALFLRTLSQLDHSPNLHTFSIISARAPTVVPQLIEISFISGDMPNLRTLELLPFPIIPQFAQLKHLTDLRLGVKYSTLTAVLDLLAANPSLEKVRLIDTFEDSEDARGPGNIILRWLQFLSVERCLQCRFLEKLTFPRQARISIRYNLISRLIPFAFTLPQSMGDHANLQGLTSLHALMAFTDNTYIDATGPNGSIAIRFVELQDPSPVCDAIASLSTTGITRLVCEFHPALIVIRMDKVTKIMDVLPYLEEIKLVHLGEANTRDFLSALRNANGWTNLRKLKFVHCRQMTNWIIDLIQVALWRKGKGLMLGSVKVVYKGGERLPESFERLERTVGKLKVVEEGTGEVMRSEVVWDDASCTTRVTSVPAE
jgi:hypothetical protein